MNHYKKLAFVLLISICASKLALATDYQAELIGCAKLTEATARSDCYEKLGQAALAAASDPEVAAATVAQAAPEASVKEVPADEPSELPDSFGGGKYADQAGVQPEKYRGKVVRCERASDRRWFYVFENGQVWKQVDNRKRRYRDCNFYVTLTKDSFGYTLQVEGEDRSVRVDRRR